MIFLLLVCCLMLDWLLLVARTEMPNRVRKTVRLQSHQKKSHAIDVTAVPFNALTEPS